MSLINAGTVSVASGSQTWNFTSSNLLTQGARAGSIIKIDGQTAWYTLAVDPPDNTQCQTLQAYVGTNAVNSAYQILTDFYPLNLAILDPSMVDSFYAMNRNFEILSNKISALGASTNDQILPRMFFGQPIEGQEWGHISLLSASQIKQLRIATDGNPPVDGNLVVDIAIAGAYQGLNLTLPSFQLWKESASVLYGVSAGSLINLKWVTVPANPGQNYTVDITYEAVVGLAGRQDFFRYFGEDIYVGLELGQGYKNATDCEVFGLHYAWQKQPPIGSNVIVELYKNNTPLGTPVLITIPATSLYGYVAHAQTAFLSTDYQKYKITQVGADVPGSGLTITAASFV